MSDIRNYYENLAKKIADVIPLNDLSKVAVECKVISQCVKDNFDSLADSHSAMQKIKFLLLHARRLDRDTEGHTLWMKELAKHGISNCLLNLFAGKSNTPLNTSTKSSSCLHYFVEQDIPILTEILSDVSGLWREVSLSLNLPSHVQKDIHSALVFMHSNSLSLSLVFREWILGGYPGALPSTADNLKKALNSKTVNCGKEANLLDANLSKQGVSFMKAKASAPSQVKKRDVEILRQSGDTSINEDKSTLLEVEISTSQVCGIVYQWKKDKCAISDNKCYLGCNMSMLCLSKVCLASGGMYTCEITAQVDNQVVIETDPIKVDVSVQSFAQSLIDHYTQNQASQEDNWPKQGKKTYINLALIKQETIDISDKESRYTLLGNADDVKKKKEKIKYDEAFGEFKAKFFVLVEGRPGSGKTTLMNKVTKDWAESKPVLIGAKVVLLITLRLLPDKPDLEIRDLIELIYKDNEVEANKMMSYMKSSNGEGVCFIIDGFDEYLYKGNENSIVLQIIHKNKLPKSMVIVSSRPIATTKLRGKANKRIEVLGFQKNQIFEYVDTYPFEKAKAKKVSGLKKYLIDHPHILHMCYLPVHASIVSYLYDQLQENSTLPQTEGEIYNQFSLYTIYRKIEIPEDIDTLNKITGQIKQDFQIICRLAFELTSSSTQTFRRNTFPYLSNMKSFLGFISRDSVAKNLGYTDLYTFSHLTFQEYLAAYHISQLTEEEQMKIIDEFCMEEKMRVVWKFYCGLVSFADNKRKFEEIISSCSDNLFQCRCSFESQQPSTCLSVVHTGCLSFSKEIFNPSDFSSIGYVAANSASLFKTLILNQCNVGECLPILVSSLEHCLNLQSLKLSNNDLDHTHAKVIADLCSKLLKLDLSNNSIGNNGIKALSDHLPACLKFLKLSRNRISDTGMQHFSKALTRYQPSLGTLDLSHNEIGNQGANALSNGLKNCLSLFALDLGDNKITDEGIASLSEGLKCCTCLMSLNLEDNKLSSSSSAQTFFKNLSSCKHIYTLNLSSMNMTDDSVKFLSSCLTELQDIDVLKLGYNNIGDIGAQAIAEGLSESVFIDEIDLSSNKIGDLGASAISKVFLFLKKLDLSCNKIGDSGIESLVEHNELTKLDLSDNSIGVKGGKAIADNLKTYSDMKKLDLFGYGITSEGAVEIAKGIKYCRSLVTLELSENKFDDNSMIELAKSLEYCELLQDLSLDDNSIGDEGAIALAERLPVDTLKSISLDNNQIGDKGTIALAEKFRFCYKLKSISLDSNAVGDDGASALAINLMNSKVLKSLCLSSNSLSDESIEQLANYLKKCPNLDTLDVDDNEISGSGAKALAENKNLNTLCLSGGNIDDESVKELADGLKENDHLKEIDLSNNKISDDGVILLVEGLIECTNLKKLNLSNNEISDVGSAALGSCLEHCGKLEVLELERNHIGRDGAVGLGQGLQLSTNLTTLELSNNEIDDEGTAALAKGLESCYSLKLLSLFGNKIGDEGARHLSNAFYESLETLYLFENQIGDDGAIALAEGLKECNKLNSLDLKDNRIGDVGARGLGNGLQHIKLSDLDLDKNLIGFNGLFSILRQCMQLQSLNLRENKVGASDVDTGSEKFKFSSSLKCLYLSDNQINDAWAVVIGRVMKCCSNLEDLSLNGNKIGDDGVKALAEGLKGCGRLDTLDLNDNEIGDDGAKYLSEHLHNWKLLDSLDLKDNAITDAGIQCIAEVIKESYDLKLNKIFNISESDTDDTECSDLSDSSLDDLNFTSPSEDSSKESHEEADCVYENLPLSAPTPSVEADCVYENLPFSAPTSSSADNGSAPLMDPLISLSQPQVPLPEPPKLLPKPKPPIPLPRKQIADKEPQALPVLVVKADHSQDTSPSLRASGKTLDIVKTKKPPSTSPKPHKKMPPSNLADIVQKTPETKTEQLLNESCENPKSVKSSHLHSLAHSKPLPPVKPKMKKETSSTTSHPKFSDLLSKFENKNGTSAKPGPKKLRRRQSVKVDMCDQPLWVRQILSKQENPNPHKPPTAEKPQNLINKTTHKPPVLKKPARSHKDDKASGALIPLGKTLVAPKSPTTGRSGTTSSNVRLPPQSSRPNQKNPPEATPCTPSWVSRSASKFSHAESEKAHTSVLKMTQAFEEDKLQKSPTPTKKLLPSPGQKVPSPSNKPWMKKKDPF